MNQNDYNQECDVHRSFFMRRNRCRACGQNEANDSSIQITR